MYSVEYGGFFKSISLNSPENITLQKAGAMEYSVQYGIHPLQDSVSPSGQPPLSQSKAYGLIWRVSLNNSAVQFIPQVRCFVCFGHYL